MKFNIKTALLGALICATVIQPMQAMNWSWKKILGAAAIIGLVSCEIIKAYYYNANDALKNAIDNNEKDSFNVAIRNGANVNVRVENLTPLCRAAVCNNLEIFMDLVEQGAKINVHDDSETSAAIFMAARHGHLGILRYFVNQGVNVNKLGYIYMWENFVQSRETWAALHLAAFNNRIEVVRYLIEDGAHIDMVTSEGVTAYKIAIRKGHLDVADLLENCENYRKSKLRMEVTEHNKNVVPPYLALDVFAQDIESMRQSFHDLFNGVDQDSDEFNENIKLVNHLLRRTEQMKLTNVNKELAFLKMKLANQKPTTINEFDAHKKLQLVAIKNSKKNNDLFFNFTNLN